MALSENFAGASVTTTTAANFIDVIGFGPTTNGVLEANNVSID